MRAKKHVGIGTVIPGKVALKRLPDLSDQPHAVCQYCGADYHARWEWTGERVEKGDWRFVAAAEDMQKHEFFCARATEETRAIVGRNP
jgi:hypothetical protein